MTTVYWLCAYLTFPGALLRAFWEHVLLRILHVSVEDAACMQRNDLCGHIEHKPVRTAGRGFALCFVPGLVLFASGAVMAVPAALQLFRMGITPVMPETGGVGVLFWICAVLYYIGVSLLCHVFPDYEDALYLTQALSETKTGAKILLFVPVWCMRAGAFLARFGVWPLCAVVVTALLILC